MRLKKCLMLIFCIVSFATTQSQVPDPAKMPNIVPPSPELASLAKVGTLSAGLHTGAANVNIPVYEISNGGIKLPIALTYSTNGVRVNEIASRVGLGWNLIAGGVVSRTIHDEDDLDPFVTQLAPPASFNPLPDNTALYNYLFTANQEDVDTEKDEYTFSVNGMSGRFFMDASGVPRLMNHSNIKLEKTAENVFIVTDPQGVKYYFGGTGYVEKTRGYSTNGNNRWDRLSQTGWFLKRIETPENNWIEFDYNDIYLKTRQGPSQSMVLAPLQGNSDGVECDISNPCTGMWKAPVFNEVYYDTKYLATIRSSNGTIVYFFHQTRGDLGGDNRIVDIKVQQAAINLTSFVKNYHLEYEDFTISNDMNQRFYLKKFYTYSTNTTGNPPVPDATLVHEFEYNDQGLPSQKSYSQDYFGYFNNKINLDFAPRLANHTNYYNGIYGADRSPDFVYMKKGALKKVIYPTGGYEEFDYEQHTLPELFSDSAYSSGQRSAIGKLYTPTSPNLATLNFSTNGIGVVKIELSAAQNPAGPFPGQQWHWYPEDAHHLVELRIKKALDNSLVYTKYLNIPYQQVNFNMVLAINTAYIAELSVFGGSTLGTVIILYSPVATTYMNNAPACGMRTKSIASFDPVTNKTIMKYYKYCNMDDLNTSTGVGAKITNCVGYYPGGGFCQSSITWNAYQYQCASQIQVSSSSLTGMVSFGGSPIAYSNVIETDDLQYVNGGIEHTFRTEYQNSTALALLGSVMPGAPYNIMADMNGIETKTKYFKKVNNNFVVLKRVLQDYSVDSRVYYGVKSYVNRKKWDPIPSLPMDERVKPFDVAEYYFSSTWFHLDNTTVSEYDPNGANPIVSTTTYTYGNTDHTSPTLITTTDSKGDPVVQQNTYPADYGIAPYTTMVAKHILTPVIENKTFRNNVLISTVKIDYLDWFSNGTVLKPQVVNMKKGNNTSESRLRYHAMDTKGNVTEVSKENDIRVSYVWDYLKTVPIAEVKNASVADIAYSSFETNDYTGNWTILGTPIPVGSSDFNTYYTYYPNEGHTGQRSYGGRLSKAINPAKNYVVTLWSKATEVPTVNVIGGTLLVTKNGWKLYKWNINGIATIIVQGSQIDEVRLHPANALMTSYTYFPFVGINTVTDAVNNISYYEYDGLNRLLLVRDIDKNIIKQYEYKYNQTIAPCAITSPDWQPTGITLCVTDANNNYTGAKEAQERNENNCSGSNYLATRWVTIATPQGDCVAVAGCTGANKRWVNGICETGVKTLVSSSQVGSTWNCVYKYVWSDGYEGPTFLESGTRMCIILVIE